MRRTVVDPRFAATLINLMADAGVSGRALAARASVSPSYLSELVNGAKMPSPDVARALDDALNSGSRLADLIFAAGHPQDLDDITAAAERTRHIGQATIDSLARVLAAQRQLDDVTGSAAMLGPVAAQLQTVTAMAVDATGPTRPALMCVAAQWAQFHGWLHTSAGRFDGAEQWFLRALQWAVEADSPDLTATVISYQGHVAWLRLQWPSALGLAQAALRQPGVYPGQRAYDAYQAARAHAVLGDVAEAEVLLAAGDELAAETDAWRGEVPAWQYYRQPWLWRLERGLVWSYAARQRPALADRAVADLKAGIDGMPAEMRGADWAAEYLVHLANAYTRGGVLCEAEEVLDRAGMVAEATRSRRVRGLVADGRRRVKVARVRG